MQTKEITLAFYGRSFPRSDWRQDLDEDALDAFLGDLQTELAPLRVVVRVLREPGTVLDIRGYGDLLNTVRLRSPRDGIGNLCLGHIIGTSPNRNIFEDIRRGVNRVAFAPETVMPEDGNRKVCHNCGCGC
ncbi:MAG: hypothetical protein C0617_06950 [Desulfuromonas sp.]|uniref:hypothetical protein n=1 Tax=Desulfuromonas sp. TaxID=892 RepID=UPI000CBCBB95|nr:hypothetical protein [Desulfuromonas sp.]PLX84755.1 MAG: hypothetical protein C0617_06950 [Desulfuromonas sp.]